MMEHIDFKQLAYLIKLEASFCLMGIWDHAKQEQMIDTLEAYCARGIKNFMNQ